MADGLHYHDDEAESGDDESIGSESSELKQCAEEAFPDEDWTPERLASLKALMKLCMGEYGEHDSGGGADDKHASTLALLFGGKPKK